MADIKSERLIHIKGGLFLCLGLLSAATLLLASPTIRTMSLLTVTVWAFARFYYYVFYVIERYVDPEYRFSGMASFVRYWVCRRRLDLSRNSFEELRALAIRQKNDRSGRG